jgi:hypothetical protein
VINQNTQEDLWLCFKVLSWPQVILVQWQKSVSTIVIKFQCPYNSLILFDWLTDFIKCLILFQKQSHDTNISSAILHQHGNNDFFKIQSLTKTCSGEVKISSFGSTIDNSMYSEILRDVLKKNLHEAVFCDRYVIYCLFCCSYCHSLMAIVLLKMQFYMI